MNSPPRVVLDTVVFVQSLISARGPAARCVEAAMAGKLVALLSDAVLDEYREVPLRPDLTRRYSHITQERVAAAVAGLSAVAVVVTNAPAAFSLPRDPKDEPLIDLAVAAGADYIVTWNARHLTYLMQANTPEGREFCARFPHLQIVSPPELLQVVDEPRL